MSLRPGELKALEGCQVSLALADGTRIDDCQLVSAPRDGLAGVWVHANGVDAVLPVSSIDAAWEVSTPCRPSASHPLTNDGTSHRPRRGATRRVTPRVVD